MPITPYLAQKRREHDANNGSFKLLSLMVRRELVGSWKLEYRYETHLRIERVSQIALLNHNHHVARFRTRLQTFCGLLQPGLHQSNYRSLAAEQVMDLFEGGLTRHGAQWQAILDIPEGDQILAIRRYFQLSPGGAGLLRELMDTLK